MKKMTAVLLALAVLVSVAGCAQKPQETVPETAAVQTAAPETAAAPETTAAEAEEVQQETCVLLHPRLVEYYECAQREDNRFVYEAKAELLELSEEEKTAYPFIDQALTEEYSRFAADRVSEFVSRFLESTKEMDLDLGGYSPYVQTTDVIRMDDHMASILYTAYEYFGGAHGTTVLQSFNYNAKELAPVMLSEIVKDNEKLQEVLVEKLRSEYPENEYFDLENDIKNYTPDPVAPDGKYPYVWTMDYDSLQIYFGEYQLGPYAMGSQRIDLAFADYPDLLVNAYGAAPENYIRRIEPFVTVTDAGQTVRVEYGTNNYGMWNSLRFLVDGSESVFDIFAGKVTVWYVKRNGFGFFFTLSEEEDDVRIFTVYKIDGGQVTELQNMKGFPAAEFRTCEAFSNITEYVPYANRKTSELPVDPAAVKLTVGDYGAQKEAVLSVEEDGTVTVK